MLLWSKRALYKALPTIFHYDAGKDMLKLKGDICTAPWLVFERRSRDDISKSDLPKSADCDDFVLFSDREESDVIFGIQFVWTLGEVVFKFMI